MRFTLVLGICLVIGLAGRLGAQAGGAASGTVADSSGAVVPGATITLTGPSGGQVAISGSAGEYRFRNLAPGTYQLSIALPGFATVTRDVVVAASEVTVPPVTLALAGIGEVIVVSATKIESKLVDAPATMTVIPTEVLISTPAQNLGDVLRAVPGVNVIQTSARDINVTSREATSTLATSQLTLLDGRTIYLDFFGLVLWDFVPSNPSDIKQIEVVRGPASAVWGANALTGVVNIITKSPREAPGTSVTFGAGAFDRGVGSTVDQGAGGLFRTDVSTSQVVNSKWAYRVAAGYFGSSAYPRPTGRIPVIPDPRDPTGRTTVGGALYPADTDGPLGTAFKNVGTRQPKFDARVDQELNGGRITYAGGVAGTSGTIYTGVGPFDIQPGSVLGYGKLNYTRGALKFNAFTNVLNAEAPNLLLPDALTGKPLQLNFKTQTYDVEIGHATTFARMHALSYGGNYRRNNFDITLAPGAQGRNELGAYVQDEIFVDKVRFSIGGRVDKFGNIDHAIFSPRVSVIVKPHADHAFRVSYNKAFRSPSTVNNYLDISLINPVDLSALAPLLGPLAPLVARPFPLVVRGVGSELPIGTTPQAKLKEESLTAYEFAYTGTIADRTTVGVAFYVNDKHDSINFVQLPPTLDPYTPANPPPGWQLPASILGLLAQSRIFLPRTAFTYLNLGPLRQKGVELSVDHRVNSMVTAFANYSWQGQPQVLDDPNPYPTIELAITPTHRFNAGGNYNGPRFLGNASVNYTDKAFWSDVLTSSFHGFTDAFTMVNGTFGVKWNGGRITTSIKSTNLFNQTIQQHVFGDLLRRSVVAEVRFAY